MKTTILDRTIMRPFVALVPKWVLPNYITIFRIFLVPVVLWLLIAGDYKIGAIVFLISAFTDAIDGTVPRTRNQITDLGKLLDPLADKLLIIPVASVMLINFLSPLVFILILFIELVTVSVSLFKKYSKNLDIKANIFGKIKMILQSLGLILVFAYAAFSANSILLSIAYYTLWAAILSAIVSLFYDRMNI